MERILSQDEINALFSSMSSGLPLPGHSSESLTAAPGGAVRYDFCRSDRISKDQIRSLNLLHSYFARNFSTTLSAYLRLLAEVNLQSIDQIAYVEFLKRLSDPTLYCAVSLPPMHGTVAIELSPAIVFPMVDILLGGPGRPASGNRTLTEIEINIMEGVLRLILRELREAWRPIAEVDPHLEKSETKAQMLQIVAPSEAVVCIVFEIKLGETSGTLSLCLPSMMLKMNRARFDQHWRPQRADADGREGAKVHNLVRSADMALAAEIHDPSLLIEDLISIGAGDIIQLDRRLSDPVLLCIGGIPKFKGRIVVRRGKRAFEIIESLDS
jgi:flagellar motor switch protein FliM